MTATDGDLDRFQEITTPDGITVRGTPRIGWHITIDEREVAHYSRSELDAWTALQVYRQQREEAQRAMASE